MPDGPKRPKLPKGAPKDVVEFADCKSDSLTLKPGKIPWLPKPPGLGSSLPAPDITFEKGEKAGTIKVNIGWGFVSTSITVGVSDGQLTLDAGAAAEVFGVGEGIDKWVKDLNEWLKSKGKKLNDITIKDGQASLTKSAVKPAAAKVPGVKTALGAGVGLKAAAVGVVLLGSGLGLGLRNYGDEVNTTTVVEERQVESAAPPVVEEPVPDPCAAPPGNRVRQPCPPTDEPVVQPAPVVLAVYSGFICLDHGAGVSHIFFGSLLNQQASGAFNASLGSGPSGPLSSSTTFTNGFGIFDFTITQFGVYDELAISAADGVPLYIGPLGPMLPFTVGPAEVACPDPATLAQPPIEEPVAPPVEPPAEPPAQVDEPPPQQPVFEQVPILTTTTTDVPPWSLLLIPGSLAVGGGLLLLGRRQEDPFAGVGGLFLGEPVEGGLATIDDPKLADQNWRALLTTEDRQQKELLGDFEALLTTVGEAQVKFNAAFDTYRSTYARVLSASTDLQGLLQAWTESKDTLAKADLAFAILTLLLSGVTLAAKGVQLVKGGQAVVAATETGTAATEVAVGSAQVDKAIGQGSAAALNLMANLQLQAKLKRLSVLVAELGEDGAAVLARYGGDITAAEAGLTRAAIAARNWHSLPLATKSLLTRILVNGRGGLRKRALSGVKYNPLAAEDVAELAKLAERPGFWEWLTRAAGPINENERGLILLYDAADVEFLRKVLESGGDITKLRNLLGPAQAAAAAQIGGASLGVGAFAGTATGAGGTMQAVMGTFETAQGLQVTDAAQWIDQFGVSSRFKESRNIGTFYAGELWQLVSSPFTTVGEYWYSYEGLGLYDEFLENYADELGTMAASLQAAVAALDTINRAVRNARLNDLSSRLGGRGAADLRSTLGQMKKLIDAAPEGFRSDHKNELDEREEHITEKLAFIEAATAELQVLGPRAGQLRDWLNEMRVLPDGSLRPVTALVDPQALLRFGSAFIYLQGVLGAVARGSSILPPPETASTCAQERYKLSQIRIRLRTMRIDVEKYRNDLIDAQRHVGGAINAIEKAAAQDELAQSLDVLQYYERELKELEAEEAEAAKALADCEARSGAG